MLSSTVRSRDQRHFLEGGLDAAAVRGARPAQADRLAEHREACPVGLDQAGEQLDHRRLAGAVLAQQRVHRAGRDAEATSSTRNGRAKGLAQAAAPTAARRSDRRPCDTSLPDVA